MNTFKIRQFPPELYKDLADEASLVVMRGLFGQLDPRHDRLQIQKELFQRANKYSSEKTPAHTLFYMAIYVFLYPRDISYIECARYINKAEEQHKDVYPRSFAYGNYEEDTVALPEGFAGNEQISTETITKAIRQLEDRVYVKRIAPITDDSLVDALVMELLFVYEAALGKIATPAISYTDLFLKIHDVHSELIIQDYVEMFQRAGVIVTLRDRADPDSTELLHRTIAANREKYGTGGYMTNRSHASNDASLTTFLKTERPRIDETLMQTVLRQEKEQENLSNKLKGGSKMHARPSLQAETLDAHFDSILNKVISSDQKEDRGKTRDLFLREMLKRPSDVPEEELVDTITLIVMDAFLFPIDISEAAIYKLSGYTMPPIKFGFLTAIPRLSYIPEDINPDRYQFQELIEKLHTYETEQLVLSRYMEPSKVEEVLAFIQTLARCFPFYEPVTKTDQFRDVARTEPVIPWMEHFFEGIHSAEEADFIREYIRYSDTPASYSLIEDVVDYKFALEGKNVRRFNRVDIVEMDSNNAGLAESLLRARDDVQREHFSSDQFDSEGLAKYYGETDKGFKKRLLTGVIREFINKTVLDPQLLVFGQFIGHHNQAILAIKRGEPVKAVPIQPSSVFRQLVGIENEASFELTHAQNLFHEKFNTEGDRVAAIQNFAHRTTQAHYDTIYQLALQVINRQPGHFKDFFDSKHSDVYSVRGAIEELDVPTYTIKTLTSQELTIEEDGHLLPLLHETEAVRDLPRVRHEIYKLSDDMSSVAKVAANIDEILRTEKIEDYLIHDYIYISKTVRRTPDSLVSLEDTLRILHSLERTVIDARRGSNEERDDIIKMRVFEFLYILLPEFLKVRDALILTNFIFKSEKLEPDELYRLVKKYKIVEYLNISFPRIAEQCMQESDPYYAARAIFEKYKSIIRKDSATLTDIIERVETYLADRDIEKPQAVAAIREYWIEELFGSYLRGDLQSIDYIDIENLRIKQKSTLFLSVFANQEHYLDDLVEIVRGGESDIAEDSVDYESDELGEVLKEAADEISSIFFNHRGDNLVSTVLMFYLPGICYDKNRYTRDQIELYLNNTFKTTAKDIHYIFIDMMNRISKMTQSNPRESQYRLILNKVVVLGNSVFRRYITSYYDNKETDRIVNIAEVREDMIQTTSSEAVLSLFNYEYVMALLTGVVARYCDVKGLSLMDYAIQFGIEQETALQLMDALSDFEVFHSDLVEVLTGLIQECVE